jgi:hypothetical protein
MKIGFEKAKIENLPLIVCSEPQAYEFFVKKGFGDTKHGDMDLSKWAPPYCGFGIFRLYGMIWNP